MHNSDESKMFLESLTIAIRPKPITRFSCFMLISIFPKRYTIEMEPKQNHFYKKMHFKNMYLKLTKITYFNKISKYVLKTVITHFLIFIYFFTFFTWNILKW